MCGGASVHTHSAYATHTYKVTLQKLEQLKSQAWNYLYGKQDCAMILMLACVVAVYVPQQRELWESVELLVLHLRGLLAWIQARDCIHIAYNFVRCIAMCP
jgi:hypothetical protein